MKAILLTLLLVSITSDLMPTTAHTQVTPTIYTSPPSVVDPDLTAGKAFTVKMMISDVEDLYSWQVFMTWTPSLLELPDAGVVFGDFLAAQPEGTTTQKRINNTLGRAIVGEAAFGNYPGVTGSGWLCSLMFTVEAVGETVLNITSPFTYALDSAQFDIWLTKQNGYFSNQVAVVQHTLSVSVVGSGNTNPAPGDHTYYDGSVISVDAIPDSGWMLDRWELDTIDVGSADPYNVSMEGDHALTAIFAETPPPQRILAISIVGSGTTHPAPGTHTYDEGAVADVTAIPDSGWMLDHWELDTVDIGEANPYGVTMDADYTLVAVFVEVPPTQYALTISVIGSGITDPTLGTHSYDGNTDVDVTAIPDSGWTLDHWELDGVEVGDVNPYMVIMDADHALKVVFIEVPVTQHDLPIGVVGSGTTDPAPGAQTYDEGTVVDATAIADTGWVFDHWSLDGINVGSANPYRVTMDANHTLIAIFAETVSDITNPVAEAGHDQTVNAGAVVSFDASASSDNVGIVSYDWDFGDGTTGTGKITTHVYTDSGTYTVTLTVKDAANNSATHTVTLIVLSTPPPAEVFPIWIIGVALAIIAAVAGATLLLKRRK